VNRLTQKELKEILNYNPETGIFTWIIDANSSVRSGDLAGTIVKRGYVTIGIRCKDMRAHRLAWLYMTGEWPKGQVDHINESKNDNRWSNLRIATSSQNRMNIGLRSDNTSGYKGVSWNKGSRKWICTIGINGKTKYLGLYLDVKEAHNAYKKASLKYHGEFSNFG
jgi:hypothetical protein